MKDFDGVFRLVQNNTIQVNTYSVQRQIEKYSHLRMHCQYHFMTLLEEADLVYRVFQIISISLALTFSL